VPVLANRTYNYILTIFYISPVAADIIMNFTVPAGCTMNGNNGAWNGNLSTSMRNVTGVSMNENTDGTDQTMKWYGLIANGANAGVVTLQWAQQTAIVGDTIFQAGSTFEIWNDL